MTINLVKKNENYIEWYEKGTLIRIEEYDGFESVITGNTLTEL